MTEREELQKQLKDIREAIQRLMPGSRAHQQLSEEQAALEAQLTGSGAVAQGDRSTSIGEDGIGVGGNLDGTLIKGEKNQIFRNSTVILAGDGARILVGEHSTEQNNKPQAVAGYALTSTTILTFLFTDIVSSTQLWERNPEAMKTALARHDAILRGAIENHKGKVFKTVGDSFYNAFPNARNALKAALAAQRTLHAELWGETVIKVRMAIHTGAVEARDGDYFGPPLNRVACLLAAGHGGQTLLSAATRELLHANLPPDMDLRDMGERRLKDLVRTEHIYQLLAADLPSEFPPLKTLDAFRTNLPAQLTSFIGREKEIAAIKGLVAKNRLVTLTGSGGAGKTRLSLEVAADLLESFSDGVWFVELAPLSDPALVPQAVMSALGIRDERSRPPVVILEDYMRARTALLVLDNCEHVVVPAARLAESLLQTCPRMRILASGREALGIAGEIVYRVPSLSVPDPHRLLGVESLGQFEATRLFIERAQAALPTFAVTDENAHAVAQVCARLDGIPLALELAAARIKVLKVEQIAERLDDCFRLLTGGSRTALPQHQTLRALIDWSHDLLPEPERVLLRRFSVFAGGWTLEAAEMVCQGEGIPDYDVLEPLMQLVNKSLVIMDADEAAEARYRLLETVRRYAHEKLTEAGEGISVRDRHLEYFLGLAERAEPELVKSQVVKWIQRLETELDNIRAALKWSFTSQNPELGLRLANALLWFWYEGYMRDGYDWLTKLLEHPRLQSHTRARALGVMGVFLATGDFGVDARPILEESLALYWELGDKAGIAHALLYEGIFIYREHDAKEGAKLILESLAMYRELDHKLGIFAALDYLGRIIYEYDYPRAHAYLIKTLEICEEIDYLSGIARSLAALGHLALRHRDYPAAHRWLEKALAAQRQLRKSRFTVYTLAHLGELASREGDYAQAQIYYKECLALIDETGGLLTMAGWLLVMFGHATLGQGDVVNAQNYFEQSMRHFRRTNEKIGIVHTVEGLARMALMQEHPAQAACLFTWADATRETIDNPRPPAEQADVDRDLATIRTQIDDDTFAASQAAGRAMTMDEAISYALKSTHD